jgi:hypothetical protein
MLVVLLPPASLVSSSSCLVMTVLMSLATMLMATSPRLALLQWREVALPSRLGSARPTFASASRGISSCPDAGASADMCQFRDSFDDYTPLPSVSYITMANGAACAVLAYLSFEFTLPLFSSSLTCIFPLPFFLLCSIANGCSSQCIPSCCASGSSGQSDTARCWSCCFHRPV